MPGQPLGRFRRTMRGCDHGIANAETDQRAALDRPVSGQADPDRRADASSSLRWAAQAPLLHLDQGVVAANPCSAPSLLPRARSRGVDLLQKLESTAEGLHFSVYSVMQQCRRYFVGNAARAAGGVDAWICREVAHCAGHCALPAMHNDDRTAAVIRLEHDRPDIRAVRIIPKPPIEPKILCRGFF